MKEVVDIHGAIEAMKEGKWVTKKEGGDAYGLLKIEGDYLLARKREDGNGVGSLSSCYAFELRAEDFHGEFVIC